MIKLEKEQTDRFADRLKQETQESVMRDIAQFSEADIVDTYAGEMPDYAEIHPMVFNMERGVHIDEAIEFLKDNPSLQPFDLILANELDFGCARSGEKNTAEEVAKALGLGYAKEYLLIMLVGFIPFTLSQCYSGTLRETGQTVVPMVAGVVSVVVNLCFNTLLIFGYLGFPRLGASGAAIATVIARFVEAGVVMLWAHRNPERVPYLRGVYRSFHIPAALARAIARKSIPLLLNETLWAAGMALLAQCYSVRGYDVVSAYNICSTVSNVFNVAFMAMGNAVGILVGQLLGAGKMEEAVDTDRKLITFSVGICIVLGGLMALVAHLFPQIYNTSDSIRDLAAAFIRICALCMPINALANACYFTLRSGGKTFVTFLFDSFYVCVLTVPMAFVLSRFTGLPIVPLFLCCQLADIGKCVVGLIMIRRGVWIQNIVGKEAA